MCVLPFFIASGKVTLVRVFGTGAGLEGPTPGREEGGGAAGGVGG